MTIIAKSKTKYEVTQFVGAPVEQDSAGKYVLKDDSALTLHSWRTGKHTKGRYVKEGQVFLTENNLPVAVVATAAVAFKNRHEYTPLQRFTSEFVDEAVLTAAKGALPGFDDWAK